MKDTQLDTRRPCNDPFVTKDISFLLKQYYRVIIKSNKLTCNHVWDNGPQWQHKYDKTFFFSF